ncbi:50S ribosomal protein L11 methyltransferase [Maritalea sp.]|uniref:50S ribosomal protein L11 methyltransferase n=1 Tax=Maritalea sp. TaxID=2003361 RepID=UPI003EF180D2
MTLEQITVPMSKQDAFALADAVMEEYGLALSASAFENADGDWVFEATCDQKPDVERFNALAKSLLKGKVEFSIQPVPDKDWVAHSLEGLSAIDTGEFFVHGSHDETPLPTGKIAIKIDAGQAFGTGHHETTTGCLQAISTVANSDTTPANILDLGTGSGILAIAAAKRFDQKILATDIDKKAIEVALENAKINDVADKIETAVSTGMDHPIFVEKGPFDLVLANILAGPLVELAPDIAKHTSEGAIVILAGLLTRQADNVIQAYETNKIALLERVEKGDWTILRLQREA